MSISAYVHIVVEAQFFVHIGIKASSIYRHSFQKQIFKYMYLDVSQHFSKSLEKITNEYLI